MPVVGVFSAPAFAQHSAGNMALPSACSYSHGRSWGFAGLSAIDSVPSSKAGASVFVRPRIANAGCFVAVEGSVGLLARGERLRVMAGHFQSHAGFASLFTPIFRAAFSSRAACASFAVGGRDATGLRPHCAFPTRGACRVLLRWDDSAFTCVRWVSVRVPAARLAALRGLRGPSLHGSRELVIVLALTFAYSVACKAAPVALEAPPPAVCGRWQSCRRLHVLPCRALA